MDSLARIKDTAAQWIARRGGESWSEADRAELELWLNASTRHRVTFLRLEALWRKANRLKVLGAGLKPGVIPTLEDWSASPFFKHIPKSDAAGSLLERDILQLAPHRTARPGARFFKARAFAIAASTLIVVALGFWGWSSSNATSYSTPIGVTASVPMADGSKVMLNTDSKIRIAITETERHVDLKQGEAFFDVAKDAARPFVVQIGNKRVIAVGTRFSVRRYGTEVQVVVTDGKVRVESREGGEGAELLAAGAVLHTARDSLLVQKKPLREAEEALSWRNGYVVFHETALTDAIAEFNRYNTRKFVIQDPNLVNILVSGNFRATNIESFAGLLEQGFPIAVDRQDDRIILTKR